MACAALQLVLRGERGQITSLVPDKNQFYALASLYKNERAQLAVLQSRSNRWERIGIIDNAVEGKLVVGADRTLLLEAQRLWEVGRDRLTPIDATFDVGFESLAAMAYQRNRFVLAGAVGPDFEHADPAAWSSVDGRTWSLFARATEGQRSSDIVVGADGLLAIAICDSRAFVRRETPQGWVVDTLDGNNACVDSVFATGDRIVAQDVPIKPSPAALAKSSDSTSWPRASGRTARSTRSSASRSRASASSR